MTRPAAATNSRLLVHGAWSLAVGVAFAAGYFISSPATIDGTRQAGPARTEEKTGARARGTAGAAARDTGANEADGTVLTSDQAKARAFQCLSERDPVEQMRQMCALIPLITKDNWRGVLAAFTLQVTKEFRASSPEWDFLFARLSKGAGADGMEELLANHTGDLDEQTQLLISGWAETDGDAALEWFRSKDPATRDRLLDSFVAGLSKADTKRTMEFLGDLPKEKAKTFMGDIVANAVQRDGFDATEETFHTLLHQPSGELSFSGDVFRTLALRRIAADQIMGNPFRALDWFDSYLRPDSPAGPVTTSQLMGAAATKDAPAAAKWLDDRASRVLPELIEPAYQPVAQAYARSAPDQFFAWLGQHENSPAYDAMAQTAIQTLHQSGHDDEAAQVLSKVQDDGRRAELELMLQKLKTPRKAGGASGQ